MEPNQSSMPVWNGMSDSKETYQRYLCSREWAERRNAVIDRCQGICERCRGDQVSHVHHLTYIRKYREELQDLQGLCEPCHQFIHGKIDVDPVSRLAPQLFGRKINSVYLAGKITSTTWREEILGTDKYHSRWSVDDVKTEWLVDGGCPIPDSIWAINYNGPFYLDLWGGHGINGGDHAFGDWAGCGDDHEEILETNYEDVRDKSFAAIEFSDLVFAWIDRADIPGTIAEITFAWACRLRPIIVIATPPSFPTNDMRFVLGLARYRIMEQPSPGSAWRYLWTDQNVRRFRNTTAINGVTIK